MRGLRVLVVSLFVLGVGADQLSSQPAAYQKLVGTWVMDSTNGTDDHGLPKSEKLVISTTATGIQIVATEDAGQGPGTSTIDCKSKPIAAPSGTGSSTQCSVRVVGDSVLYALDIRNNGTVVAGERGRLVVRSDGHTMRDQYNATEDTKPATHHRHIYSKQG